VVGKELGEHAELAHAARDQLRVLAAVVEHHDFVGGALALERELPRRAGLRRGARSRGTRDSSSVDGKRYRPAAGAHRLDALEVLALRLQRRRLATVADVAGAMHYLAWDASAGVTGHLLRVDGYWAAW
jgi:hypothetical protein